MSILYTVLTFFVPAVIIICGYIMKNCHSAEPNPTVGYRTARSMSSRESWVFANERCGGLWIKIGSIAAAVSLPFCAAYFFISTAYGAALMCALMLLQTAAMLLSIPRVEKELKEKFGDK
jgi:uncharacterized membrane protein